MWFIEMVLQQSLSGRGLSSTGGATHADGDSRTAEFFNRFLEIISFALGRGIHLPTAFIKRFFSKWSEHIYLRMYLNLIAG